MKIEVSEFEKKYSFELEPVTQLCGQNVISKTYILESIRRYFSTYKYQEETNKWRDNVRVDGELVGRKYFSVLSIAEAADILAAIKWSKQSMLMEYVKELMQHFDWQMHLRIIGDELEKMFGQLNDVIGQLGNIEMNYDESSIWDMVQKTNVTGKEQASLEDLNNEELIDIALNLLDEVLTAVPKKMIIIFENIDHLVDVSTYRKIVCKMYDMSAKFDIRFLLTTSLEGYVYCSKELCQGIMVLNSFEYQMPEFERIESYIYGHYPINKKIPENELQNLIEKIVHKIGKERYLVTVEESVICKILNQTLLLNDRWEKDEILPEISFLKA